MDGYPPEEWDPNGRVYLGQLRYEIPCPRCGHVNVTRWPRNQYGYETWRRCTQCEHIIRYKLLDDPKTRVLG